MVSLAGPGSRAATDWPPPSSRVVLAWRDIVQGFRRSWIWTALAYQDIRLRYRGSVLGPFWLTISTLVMVVAMGFIYAHLFHTDTRSYMPYLTLGLIVWQLISTLVTEGCQTFLASGPVIQQVPIPFSIHAYRVVYRNFIVFAHNLVIVPHRAARLCDPARLACPRGDRRLRRARRQWGLGLHLPRHA